MDQGPTPRRLTEGGFTSTQFVLASALALVLFMALANLIVVQYGRGAVRSAIEQGARAGSVSGSVADCELMARDVLGQLLGGVMSDGVVIRCVSGPDRVRAMAEGVFESWTPLAPDFRLVVDTEATLEPHRP